MSAPNRPLNLDEARLNPDGYLIVDGEWGGICYLVYPARLVECDEKTLQLLAHDLEEAIFAGGSEGAKVWYERLTLNEELSGYAMGEDSGIALKTLWLPKWSIEARLSEAIHQILDRKRERLNLTLSQQAKVAVLHTEYHARKFEKDLAE